MPYIVCVNRPGYLPEQSPRATATLDEARWATAEEIARSDEGDTAFTPHERSLADDAISEQGGQYHLPDGYVIDVMYATYGELAAFAQIGAGDYGDGHEIIDAYNEQG